MSNPRKFAEKIALIQQKQAEGDAAFNTIIYEVEAAKQRAEVTPTAKGKLDVPSRKYEKPFENYQGSNGMNNSDNNYVPQQIKIDNGNEGDRLLQLPDNSSWRRTHSDSSLHHAMMPTVVAHYHARMQNDNNGQIPDFDLNNIKYEPTSYSSNPQPHHLQVSNSPFQQQQQVQHQFDFNHNLNQNYNNGRTHTGYPLPPIGPTTSLPSPNILSNQSNHNNHALLGPRYSGGPTGSNVLMLPPTHQPRGGSLPDLRTEDSYHHQQLSFSTVPSPPTSTQQQHFFRSSSPQQNGDGDLYIYGHQQQLSSNVGPLKQSPSIRRRHSPIGEVKQSSPRRHSPSPDVSSNQQTIYRVEPSSPQSQSSYSPQNSPHLLPSPGNDHGPFSPQQSTDNNGNNQQQQPYFTLPTHFDQITLDNNFYTQQQQQTSSSPSSPTAVLTSLSNDMNGIHLNYFRPRNFYPTFMNDTSSSYCQTQTTVTVTTNVNQKSPTIPNIILTDVDSSKLDLSKELANEFSNTFDGLIDPNDLQLTSDDFLLNASDLSIDPHLCDDTFRMEN